MGVAGPLGWSPQSGGRRPGTRSAVCGLRRRRERAEPVRGGRPVPTDLLCLWAAWHRTRPGKAAWPRPLQSAAHALFVAEVTHSLGPCPHPHTLPRHGLPRPPPPRAPGRVQGFSRQPLEGPGLGSQETSSSEGGGVGRPFPELPQLGAELRGLS